MARRKRGWSGITVTDQFCGAGGSSIGAHAAGLQVRLAMNHWKLAIETHNTNFPNTDHDCTDISAADPRRYPSTDILITSPECTTHSPAGGTRRSKPQRDFFDPHAEDPETARSRATMWDVPRFAEYHQYRIIITENVFEVTRWPLFADWLRTMDTLGYNHRIVSLNSRFAHPTPQSRDRVYIVFWWMGDRAPMLDHRPLGPCPRCEKPRECYQAFNPGRRVGKYERQYVYRCFTCHAETVPFYFASLNALDLSIRGKRIGDRTTPLRPRTMERIRFGLEKFGRQSLIVRTNMTSGVGCRVRPAAGEPLFTQTASNLDGVLEPVCTVETAFTNSESRRSRDVKEAFPTQSGQATAALVSVPFLVGTSNSFAKNPNVRGGLESMATRTTAEDQGVVVPPFAFVPNRNNCRPRAADDVLPGICTGGHQMMVSPSALITLRSSENIARHLGQSLPTQVATAIQDWIVSPTPFISSYYGTANGAPVSESLPSIVTLDRHSLVEPRGELDIEDCYFRMLQNHEIGAGMAFPRSYTVLGTKREVTKQYGNAVTPPAMRWLIGQCVEALAA